MKKSPVFLAVVLTCTLFALAAPASPTVNGTVYAVAGQPDGKVVLAGQFNNVNNQQAEGIARINSDGSLDTEFPAGGSTNGIFGTVYALAVAPDGSIVAGGEFNRAGSSQALNIVRYEADGSIDTNFASQGGINGIVYALSILPDGRIVAGGEFTTAAGQPAQNLAVLNADGTLSSAAAGSLPTGIVRAVTGTTSGAGPEVAAGGNFVSASGTARNLVLLPVTTEP
jgi:uncharacterized delta-60 repeat protein